MADRDRADRDIELVLVTGAGASRAFGINHTTIPLMGEWSDGLVDKIKGRSWAYLAATDLTKGLNGPEFEQRLGRFLQLAQAIPRIGQVLTPSLEFQPVEGLVEDSLTKWHRNTIHHVSEITNLIHESLYETFSSERMDLDGAASAYGSLLGQLGINNTHSMVYATTNYDVVGEYVIERLGGLPDWGEQRRIGRQGESPLRVDRLVDGMPRYVPVLHLHGRIGWFRRESGRPYSADSTAYHPDFGVPIVMLPDPDKSYESDPVILSLWSQFEEVLRRARRVLVLGHSLNDRPLVDALKRNVTPPERVAVTVLGDTNQPDQVAPDTGTISEILRADLPAAAIIPIHFAENAIAIEKAAATWNERLSRAAEQRSA